VRVNNTFFRLLVLISIVAVITACVHTKSTYLSPSAEKYPLVNPDSVQLFMSESELDSLDYVRVALIEATGNSRSTSQTGMYNAMRKKAGKLGCNGVLLPQINEPGAGAKVAAAFLGVRAERKGNAVAIRVLGKKQPVTQRPTQP